MTQKRYNWNLIGSTPGFPTAQKPQELFASISDEGEGQLLSSQGHCVSMTIDGVVDATTQ
ncbi:MAG: hypothetical protein ACYCPO_00790 [Acidobacteriaceae bacterium]